MALIKCPECENSFSDKALSCPSCGFRAGKYAGKSKGLALVLAIFLGGLGIHKFYLGQSGAGILYLIFCWTFVPLILSIVDIILLLTKSKSEFGDLQSLSNRQVMEERFTARFDDNQSNF